MNLPENDEIDMYFPEGMNDGSISIFNLDQEDEEDQDDEEYEHDIWT